MPATPDFHDGSFDGLKIDGQKVTIFLRTHSGEAFVGIAEGVAALKADDVRAGNVLFEAVIRSSDQITVDAIDELYDLPLADPIFQRDKYLESAKQKKLVLLEISPSYGATCLVLAESIRFEAA